MKAWIAGIKKQHRELQQPEEEHLDELLWIPDRTDEIAKYRNAFVHTIISATDEKIMFDWCSGKTSYIQYLKEIDEKELFIPVWRDVYNLWKHALAILRVVYYLSNSEALPERPQLPGSPSCIPHRKKNTQNRNSSELPSRRKSSPP